MGTCGRFVVQWVVAEPIFWQGSHHGSEGSWLIATRRPMSSACGMPQLLASATSTAYLLFLLACGGGSAPSQAPPSPRTAVPVAPTNLGATPGDGQVALVWSASAGATAYHMAQATVSGGPFVEVAASTPTNCQVTGLTNGTTYNFVVTASNAIGASKNSNQASAVPAAMALGIWWTTNGGSTWVQLDFSCDTDGYDRRRILPGCGDLRWYPLHHRGELLGQGHLALG